MKFNIKDFTLRNNKKILIFLILFVLLYTLIIGINLETHSGQDGFWYMTLGKNLATGNGYTFDGINPHPQYPPGLPILLIPFFLLLGDIYLSSLIILAIISVLTLFLTYKLGEKKDFLTAIISVLLISFSYLFASFTTFVSTEIPFAFFSLLGLYLFIKGFENPKYFIYAFPIIAFSCLIRYDGFFLIFPMIFYTYFQKNKIKKLITNNFTLAGIGIGVFILGAWFFRNLLAFGNPFYTSYSGYSLELGFSSIYSFFIHFFYTGFLLPIFTLIGIYYLIRKKDLFFSTFIIWFFSYIVLHSIWGFKLTRFYVEILPIIVIFASIGIIKTLKFLAKNNKEKFNVFLILFIIIILISQIFIFFNPIGNWGDSNIIPKINNYKPIKQISEYSNNNLPKDALYIVPDYPSYNMYLNKENIYDYSNGFNYLFSKEYDKKYLLVDTIHSWITNDFLKAKTGDFSIIVPSSNNINVKVDFETKLLEQAYREKFLGQMRKNNSCFIVEITNMTMSRYSE